MVSTSQTLDRGLNSRLIPFWSQHQESHGSTFPWILCWQQELKVMLPPEQPSVQFHRALSRSQHSAQLLGVGVLLHHGKVKNSCT